MKSIKKVLTSKITREKIENFIKNYSTDKLTLDLGCANSWYTKYFKNRIGLDIYKGKGVDVVGDAHSLPFEDNKFDLILCTEVLEHLHSPQIAISEMHRVLKKDGLLILTTRFIFPLHDSPNDFYRYTKFGLEYLFKEGWRIERLEEEVNTKNTIAVLIQRIGYQTNLKGGVFVKIFIFLIAWLIYVLPNFIKEEYGNMSKSIKVDNILTSGYYLVCRKI
jgi:SAM-dependent methyltransferase